MFFFSKNFKNKKKNDTKKAHTKEKKKKKKKKKKRVVRAFFFSPLSSLSARVVGTRLSLSLSLFFRRGARAVFFCPRVVVRRLLNSFLGGRENAKGKKTTTTTTTTTRFKNTRAKKKKMMKRNNDKNDGRFRSKTYRKSVIAHVFSFLPALSVVNCMLSSKRMYRAAMSDGTCWKKQAKNSQNIESLVDLREKARRDIFRNSEKDEEKVKESGEYYRKVFIEMQKYPLMRYRFLKAIPTLGLNVQELSREEVEKTEVQKRRGYLAGSVLTRRKDTRKRKMRRWNSKTMMRCRKWTRTKRKMYRKFVATTRNEPRMVALKKDAPNREQAIKTS